MPLIILILAVVVQAVTVHGVTRTLVGPSADRYYGMAAFAGLATFITFNNRDALPWWPALPLLVCTGALAHWLSVQVHQRFSR